jgi:hypothetical protein
VHDLDCVLYQFEAAIGVCAVRPGQGAWCHVVVVAGGVRVAAIITCCCHIWRDLDRRIILLRPVVYMEVEKYMTVWVMNLFGQLDQS